MEESGSNIERVVNVYPDIISYMKSVSDDRSRLTYVVYEI